MALTRIIGKARGAKRALAKDSGLLPTQITAYTKGDYRPQLEQFEKLLNAVPDREDKAALVLAYVEDAIPPAWRSTVKVIIA